MKKKEEALFLLSEEKIFYFDRLFSYQEIAEIISQYNKKLNERLGNNYRIIFKKKNVQNQKVNYQGFIQVKTFFGYKNKSYSGKYGLEIDDNSDFNNRLSYLVDEKKDKELKMMFSNKSLKVLK